MALDIPIIINRRLRSTMGAFIRDEDSPHSIEISGNILKYGAKSAILDVLYHELIHYALFIRGEPFRDGQVHFEAELRRYGVSSTSSNFIGRKCEFTCDGCGDSIDTTTQAIAKNPKAYKSRCCHAELIYVGERIYDGTEVV